MSEKIITQNKKALAENQILEKWQTGIKLSGSEVKSVKKGQIDLKGSYITIKPGKNNHPEAWLVAAHIGKYTKAGYASEGYDPTRSRKLLLTGRELASIAGKIKQKGLTILPILVYTSRRLVKLEIGLAKGKKKFDKRETIKKRDFDIRKSRLLKN